MWLNFGWSLGIWTIGWVLGRMLCEGIYRYGHLLLWGTSGRSSARRQGRPTSPDYGDTKYYPIYGLHFYKTFIQDLSEASGLVLDLSPNTPFDPNTKTYQMMILYVRNMAIHCPLLNVLKRGDRICIAYHPNQQNTGWHCTAVYTEDGHTSEHSTLIVSVLMSRLQNRYVV